MSYRQLRELLTTFRFKLEHNVLKTAFEENVVQLK